MYTFYNQSFSLLPRHKNAISMQIPIKINSRPKSHNKHYLLQHILSLLSMLSPFSAAVRVHRTFYARVCILWAQNAQHFASVGVVNCARRLIVLRIFMPQSCRRWRHKSTFQRSPEFEAWSFTKLRVTSGRRAQKNTPVAKRVSENFARLQSLQETRRGNVQNEEINEFTAHDTWQIWTHATAKLAFVFASWVEFRNDFDWIQLQSQLYGLRDMRAHVKFIDPCRGETQSRSPSLSRILNA